jgi:phosphoglycolate phosphatase-like HAD superfamily hydrolase
MRDYGIVRVRFWEWAKRKQIDADERELALYLLTSPHGNSLGCYRLPMAYLCDDLGKDVETAARALSRLSAIGFLEREEVSGWTWIVGYLDHNPIPNRNVGKAVEKQLDAVPVVVPFYGKMIEVLRPIGRSDDKGLSSAFLDRVEERYRNRSDTASQAANSVEEQYRSRSDTVEEQYRNQTQTQTHEHDHSEAKASAADTPLQQMVDLRKEIFDAGVGILVAGGKRESSARSMIGKWRKDHGDEATFEAIRQAQKAGPSEPISYITACLKASRLAEDTVRTAAEIAAEADKALAGVDY